MEESEDNGVKVKAWDIKTFERLFVSLYPGLCSVADYYLKDEVQSKDIAQEAFIKLWDKRSEDCDIVSVKSWLYTTVRNLSLNYLRDHRKEKGMPKILPEQTDADFKAVIIEEETIRILYEAVDRLPSQSARIIRLTLKGAKNQEIAELLDISVNSVKTLKYNAIHTLRKELNGLAWLILFWIEYHP